MSKIILISWEGEGVTVGSGLDNLTSPSVATLSQAARAATTVFYGFCFAKKRAFSTLSSYQVLTPMPPANASL
jgi:hypothetical protein